MRPSQLASLNTIRWQGPPWSQPLLSPKRCDWVKNVTEKVESAIVDSCWFNFCWFISPPHVFAYVLFLTSFLLVEMQPTSFWKAPSPQPLNRCKGAPVERGALELENWEDMAPVVIFTSSMTWCRKKAKPNYKNTNQFTIVYQYVHGKQW